VLLVCVCNEREGVGVGRTGADYAGAYD
jgi:hypothetical protein